MCSSTSKHTNQTCLAKAVGWSIHCAIAVYRSAANGRWLSNIHLMSAVSLSSFALFLIHTANRSAPLCEGGPGTIVADSENNGWRRICDLFSGCHILNSHVVESILLMYVGRPQCGVAPLKLIAKMFAAVKFCGAPIRRSVEMSQAGRTTGGHLLPSEFR